jgi:5-methylcytosine-specific restriction protein A
MTGTSRCFLHASRAKRDRGTFRQRGYGKAHDKRFRPGVLARDPVCVVCRQAPATVADHWPLDRVVLVRRGMDPDDPANGRGLCQSCHNSHTAKTRGGGERSF